MRGRNASWAVLAAVIVCSACFIDSGDCVSQGVEIEPCAVPMKVGQTRVFKAQVTADPNDDVMWVATAALDAGFDPSVGENEIELIGTLGAPGIYKLRAESASDPARFGETIITVLGNSYGYPPSPVQLNGADFPDDYDTAVAAGGNRYYVAYADPGAIARGQPDNFFVKQFDLASNTERVSISGQFTLFGTPTGVAPNVAADCQGNGYWLDRPTGSGPVVLRRLSAAGVFSEFTLTNFEPFGMFGAACDGTLYLSGVDLSADVFGIFRIPAFGSPPVEFPIAGLSNALDVFETVALDAEGRLLLADVDAEGCSQFGQGIEQVVRIVPAPGGATGMIDPTFVPDLGGRVQFLDGVRTLTIDAGGVVYVVPVPESDCVPLPATSVLGFNSAGLLVYSIDEYVYECSGGCASADCGTQVPFQEIRGISVSAQGKLRIVDDVTLGLDPTDPCQTTMRLVLLDP